MLDYIKARLLPMTVAIAAIGSLLVAQVDSSFEYTVFNFGWPLHAAVLYSGQIAADHEWTLQLRSFGPLLVDLVVISWVSISMVYFVRSAQPNKQYFQVGLRQFMTISLAAGLTAWLWTCEPYLDPYLQSWDRKLHSPYLHPALRLPVLFGVACSILINGRMIADAYLGISRSLEPKVRNGTKGDSK